MKAIALAALGMEMVYVIGGAEFEQIFIGMFVLLIVLVARIGSLLTRRPKEDTNV